MHRSWESDKTGKAVQKCASNQRVRRVIGKDRTMGINNMKIGIVALTLCFSFFVWIATAQDRPPQSRSQRDHEPPPQAYEDCRGKNAGDKVQHTTPEGKVTATCVESPKGLVARPDRSPQGRQGGQAPEERRRDRQEIRPQQDRRGDRPDTRPPEPNTKREQRPRDAAREYSIEQAVSDQAQLHTIAFNGLAFLTGNFGADTFLPPGKVSDYFGFQYMRDIDTAEGGHNTSFLTRIAQNMLAILNDDQKSELLALAQEQENDIELFARKRLPVIKAFRRNLEGDLPIGAKGLNKNAVIKYSADLYELDGLLAFHRAKVMGNIIFSLNDRQKSALLGLKFGDSRTWPDRPESLDRKSMPHNINVAIMTYASEMFSWQAGSLQADTYFCPERHGMYFGGFGMKTAPAMGKRNYSIDTALTGNKGEAFLAELTDIQRNLITNLLTLQRNNLYEIVKTRRAIAVELRLFLRGESADEAKVLSLSRKYGELDGEISYLYATAFAKIGQTLTARQKERLARMRTSNPADPKGPFLYSSPIDTPEIEDTDFLF